MQSVIHSVAVVLVLLASSALAGPARISVGSPDVSWPASPSLQTFTPTDDETSFFVYGPDSGIEGAELGNVQSFRVADRFLLESIFIAYRSFDLGERHTADVTLYEVHDVWADVFTSANVIAQGLGLSIVPATLLRTDENGVFRLDVLDDVILEPKVGNSGYAIQVISSGDQSPPPFYWLDDRATTHLQKAPRTYPVRVPAMI